MMKRYTTNEICELLGVEIHVLVAFIEKDWIQPVCLEEREFDDEDLARVKLILDLKNNFEVNEESVPIILHLLDQIHRLHFKLRKYDQK